MKKLRNTSSTNNKSNKFSQLQKARDVQNNRKSGRKNANVANLSVASTQPRKINIYPEQRNYNIRYTNIISRRKTNIIITQENKFTKREQKHKERQNNPGLPKAEKN